jgi:ABC-type glycerol-3-phosphate transport system permease component
MENFTKKPTKSLARGLFSHQDRKKPVIRLALFAGYLVLGAGAVLTLAPILWMLLGSFKAPDEI